MFIYPSVGTSQGLYNLKYPGKYPEIRDNLEKSSTNRTTAIKPGIGMEKCGSIFPFVMYYKNPAQSALDNSNSHALKIFVPS